MQEPVEVDLNDQATYHDDDRIWSTGGGMDMDMDESWVMRPVFTGPLCIFTGHSGPDG